MRRWAVEIFGPILPLNKFGLLFPNNCTSKIANFSLVTVPRSLSYQLSSRKPFFKSRFSSSYDPHPRPENYTLSVRAASWRKSVRQIVFSCRVHAVLGYFRKSWTAVCCRVHAFRFCFESLKFPYVLGVAAAPPVEVLITEVGHLLLGPRVGVRRQLFFFLSFKF